MKIAITLFAILLTGCSGYKSDLVPLDPPPAEELPKSKTFIEWFPLQLDWENHKIRAKIDT